MNEIDLEQLRKNLEEIGKETVANIVEQLIKADKNVTGNLINSLKYEILETSSGLMLHILANDYFDVVDKGRRPGKQPPSKALIPWIESRGIVMMNDRGGIVSTESAAFIISRSIGEKGIKPLNIKQEVIDNVINAKQQLIQDGLSIDIRKYIDDIIKN